MAYLIDAGIQVSLTGASGSWQKLTDHNRSPIQISPELIESQSRMANGKMRKYVIAQKNKISVSWKYVPSKQSETADGFFSASWLESFYKSNAGLPIYLKVISSELDPDPAADERIIPPRFRLCVCPFIYFQYFFNYRNKLQ